MNAKEKLERFQGETEEQQAERWACAYETADRWAKLTDEQRQTRVFYMRALVHEARRAHRPMTGIGDTDFERTESLISRRYASLRNARDPQWSEIPYTIRVPVIRAVAAELNRPAPLTEEEALAWYRKEYEQWLAKEDGVSCSLKEFSAGLMARASRGEIPPEVRKSEQANLTEQETTRLALAAAAKEGYFFDQSTGKWSYPPILTPEEEAIAPIDPDSGRRAPSDSDAIDHYREGLYRIMSGEAEPREIAASYLGENVPTIPGKPDSSVTWYCGNCGAPHNEGVFDCGGCGQGGSVGPAETARARYVCPHCRYVYVAPDTAAPQCPNDQTRLVAEPPPVAEIAVVLGTGDDAGPASEELDASNIDHSEDIRPAVLGGECSFCLHRPPLHEPWCDRAF